MPRYTLHFRRQTLIRIDGLDDGQQFSCLQQFLAGMRVANHAARAARLYAAEARNLDATRPLAILLEGRRIVAWRCIYPDAELVVGKDADASEI